MKTYVLIIFLAFNCLVQAEPVIKLAKESTVAMVERLAPTNTVVKHPPFALSKWGGIYTAIVAFYEELPANDDLTGSTTIQAVVYLGDAQNHFNKVVFDVYGAEGGNPKIESVFLAKGKQHKQALVVMVSWDVNHAGVHGTLYKTFIYERPISANVENLLFMETLSHKLSGGCDCDYGNGSTQIVHYKTAKQVAKALN
jgi:hypothetical protein